METFVLIIPLLTVLLFWAINKKTLLHIMNIVGISLTLLVSLFSTYKILTLGNVNFPHPNGFFYIDWISILILDTTLLVSFIVCIYSTGYINEEYKHGVMDMRRIKLFYTFMHAFIFTMVLVLTTQNLGLMWIAIEATTLASAFLVGFYNNKNSIEATWKYIIICSVGIAFALLGIVLLHFSSVNIVSESDLRLNWLLLYQNASSLDSSILKIAFIFILVGFGTKVGLVPMHTWLPDAHSQAPSPISALLSGVLLNTAMYGIIRALSIVNKNLGNSVYTGRLLMTMGLLSVAAAAIFILPQKDYKRLLAYSSIEHMGIVAFGLGIFTPLSIFASLFHMLNHSFTKSMLFLSSGNVYIKYNTREISKVTGLLKTLPVTGITFLLGLFAIAGVPPFSVFSSEFGVILATFNSGHSIQGICFVLFIAIVFAVIAASLLKMFFGNNENKNITPGELNISSTVSILLLLVVIAVTGVYLPQNVKIILESATKIITGG